MLVIDSSKNDLDYLKLHFEEQGFEIRTSADGIDGFNQFRTMNPDIVLLEINLPQKDGWQVCKDIRKMSNTPIIFITQRGEVFDKVLGFELGGDDYLVKPYDIKELDARIKAVLRRCKPEMEPNNKNILRFDNLEISIEKYELKLRGQPQKIPPKELQLLYYLASNYNRVFTRDTLLDKVWGFDYLGDSRTVDVHIKRLRAKLNGISDQWALRTVWGVGYKFELL